MITLLKMTTIMKIRNLFSFLLVLCLLFACQTSQQVLHRSKPLRVQESQAIYTTEKNQTLTGTNKGINTPIEVAEPQTAASNTEQAPTLALPLAHEIKPLTTETSKRRPQTIKRQLTQKIVPHINKQTTPKDALGSTGFFGSVGHTFAVVGLVFLVVGLIFYIMGGLIGMPLGAFFIACGFIFLIIWLVLFIIQSVFDVIL